MNDSFYVVTTIGMDGYSKTLFNQETGVSISIATVQHYNSGVPNKLSSTAILIPHTTLRAGKIATDEASLQNPPLNYEWTKVMKKNRPGLRYRYNASSIDL